MTWAQVCTKYERCRLETPSTMIRYGLSWYKPQEVSKAISGVITPTRKLIPHMTRSNQPDRCVYGGMVVAKAATFTTTT